MMKTNEPTYTIKVTERQLKELSNACEVVARLRIGQPEDALRELRGESEAFVVMEDFEKFYEMERVVQDSTGFSRGASWGVGKFEDADILFDMHQVFRNVTSWAHAKRCKLTESDGSRNWNTMMTVNYDEPMKYSSQPLPEVKEDSNGQ